MTAQSTFQKVVAGLHYRFMLTTIILSVISGSAAAIFLISLEALSELREANLWFIALLPLAGLIIGLTYHHFGATAYKGNELIFEVYRNPKERIRLRTAPLVFIGTLLTHLVGGSAGREGTSVQMSGAFADTFSRWFSFDRSQRRLLLLCGISGGFAAVFGTPWAGAVFALEVMALKKWRFDAVLPVILTAWLSHWVCLAWPVTHSHYQAGPLPDWAWSSLLWVGLLGIASGLTALTFVRSTHLFKKIFQRISYPPYRPFVGGAILALLFLIPGSLRYAGLGLPVIAAAFHEPLLPWDFILKLLFTAFTLGAAFKGGEVTPLFFIGAALGNLLALFIPLPMAMLAALGFVAVFAGATNTPLACWVMGMELFGWEYGLWLGLACGMAYLFSGRYSIYTKQPLSPFRRYLHHKQLLHNRKAGR